MARLNEVHLYGCVAEQPLVTIRDDTGEPVQAAFHINVLKEQRDSGERDKDIIKSDWPLIFTKDPEMVKKIAKLKIFDVVDLVGTFTTGHVKKITICAHCKNRNVVDGNIYYVNPLFLAKRNIESLTEAQAMQTLRDNMQISNHIHVMGNICNDVNYFKSPNGGKIETAVYQIAVDRRVRVKGDEIATHTDFPIIRSYGKTARLDNLCLHKGSLILIDGYLHSKKFSRTSECADPTCKKNYKWEDTVTEVIPFAGAVEYLNDYTDPETALAEIEAKNIEEGQNAAATIFGQASAPSS